MNHFVQILKLGTVLLQDTTITVVRVIMALRTVRAHGILRVSILLFRDTVTIAVAKVSVALWVVGVRVLQILRVGAVLVQDTTIPAPRALMALLIVRILGVSILLSRDTVTIAVARVLVALSCRWLGSSRSRRPPAAPQRRLRW